MECTAERTGTGCRLGGPDYIGLDMLNVKMMQTGTNDVC